MRAGLDKLAPAVDSVMSEQRLKALAKGPAEPSKCTDACDVLPPPRHT
jgi:hypothetical protein